ncbi:MAG TPA: PAS domain-containing protein [Flavipsychrobacter sp.]|nr:PAS domain-containing protein [Flavipsychrobacter sp.]
MSIHFVEKKETVAQEQVSAEQLIDTITDLVSIMSMVYQLNEKKLQYVASQVTSELGYSEQEVKADTFDILSIFHPEDRDAFINALSSLGGKVKYIPEFDCRMLHKDGRYFTYKIRARAFSKEGRDSDTAIVAAIHTETATRTAIDATELKRIQVETERILQFGTFEYNIANGDAIWSDGLYEIFGYKDERPDITYETFLSHIASEKFDGLAENIIKNISSQQTYTEEYEILTKDNKRKFVQITGSRLYNTDGIPYKDLGIMKDVTKEHLQEEKVNNAIDDLQRSNSELENFAYVASHDLQEPVRKISTFSSRLIAKLSSQISDEDKMYLNRIATSADSMRMLIDNLLEFSRISRNKQLFMDTNLNFIMHQVKTDLELTIEQTGTKIIYDSLPTVQASPTQIKQLFNNIIGNAIKFRKKAVSPVINVTSSVLSAHEKKEHKLQDDVEYYKVQISDNGIGFEDEYAIRIFQIFQRLHGKSEYPGSGIGLAICKKIVEQHQGIIFAKNIPDTGAGFTVVLPEKRINT